jgi:hypothetical protein
MIAVSFQRGLAAQQLGDPPVAQTRNVSRHGHSLVGH